MIPVIDIFCGAGGLGEGFAAARFKGAGVFDVALSIDNNKDALATLRLRKFFHQFPRDRVPEEYYRFLHADERKKDKALAEHKLELHRT